MIAITISICVLMAFSFFMLVYTPKRLYKVHYLRLGFCRTELSIFLKAKNLADIQKQLNKKEAPWDVIILSAEVV